jgi:hypothetical protein
MSDNIGYVVVKNGKLLSHILSDNKGDMFKANKPRDAYVYTAKLIAGDIANQLGATIAEVHKPNFPFGDWELKSCKQS